MTLSTRFDQSELERALEFAFTNLRPRLTAFTEDVVAVPDYDYDHAVASGVEFLDQRLGREFWLPRIDVETLDVSSQLSCVVCQLTGRSFWPGVTLLGGPGDDDPYTRLDWAVARGFALHAPRDGSLTNYGPLTVTWRTRVLELRRQAADSARVADDSVRITA
jgi:hypothetical protein